MIENNPGPGVPDKPVGPPMSGRRQGQETLVSDQPAKTKNVSSRLRSLRFGKKRADASKSENAVLDAKASLSNTGKSRRKVTWYWVAGAAAVLLVGGIVLGTTIPDPKKSEAYIALSSDKDDVSGQLNSLQGRFDSLAAGIEDREADVAAREVALEEEAEKVKAADAVVKAAEKAVKSREEAVTGAEKTKAANTIGEGTWTVGVDLKPGTYRVTADVSSTCYWGIYRTGSNGSDIIENDIVNGGRPSVTLSAGQDFETSDCGTWTKQ